MKRFILITVALCVLGSSLFVSSGAARAATNGANGANWTVCKTVSLGSPWWLPIQPHMAVPVCYNGSSVWQSGSTTAGVNTYGYVLDGISWSGSYNGGGSWLGVGENYTVTIYGGWATFSCASRWYIDAWGNVTNYSEGC